MFFPKCVSSDKVSRVWGDILGVAFRCPQLFLFFKERVLIEMRCGNEVSFWNDVWVGGRTLKEEFPRLFSLEVCKHASVGSVWAMNLMGWDGLFRRQLRSWEDLELCRLRNMVSSASAVREGATDNIVWKGEGNIFSVKSIYD